MTITILGFRLGEKIALRFQVAHSSEDKITRLRGSHSRRRLSRNRCAYVLLDLNRVMR
jgi:hypothetical protein